MDKYPAKTKPEDNAAETKPSDDKKEKPDSAFAFDLMEKEKLSLPEAYALKEYFGRDDV